MMHEYRRRKVDEGWAPTSPYQNAAGVKPSARQWVTVCYSRRMKRIASLLFTLPAVAVACSSDPGGGGSADAGTDAAAEVPASLVGRDSDPVVLTGASLPTLLGKPPGDVVAFARSGGAWQAVPVQVDERFLGDFCQVYAASKLGANAPCKTALKIETLFYADPSTYTGADPNAALDPDDEVVLMARQAGARWSGSDAPTGVTPGSAVEVQLADGPSSAFVYLFVRSDATLPPSAGQDLVSYQQTFENVPAGFAYKNDYPFTGSGSCGYNPNDPPIPCNAPILEDSVVKSAAYERHFAARWVTDRLRITQPGSDGIDVLDDAQARFAPNVCGRTVNTFSTAEGAFIANVDGPVRAIRSYLGANSGPLTQRTHLFYDRLEVVQTMLRVHQVGGIMDLEDYAPAATGMTYASSEVPGGVPIDGQPDAVAGAVPAWELISGPHGSILHTLRGERVDARHEPGVLPGRRERRRDERSVRALERRQSGPGRVGPIGRVADQHDSRHGSAQRQRRARVLRADQLVRGAGLRRGSRDGEGRAGAAPQRGARGGCERRLRRRHVRRGRVVRSGLRAVPRGVRRPALRSVGELRELRGGLQQRRGVGEHVWQRHVRRGRAKTELRARLLDAAVRGLRRVPENALRDALRRVR